MVRGSKRILVNTYTEFFMPYADAKVPSALYKYGPVKYVIKGGIRLSDDWILEHTVPNIVKVCAMEVDLILALPLMWSDFHGNKSQFFSGHS